MKKKYLVLQIRKENATWLKDFLPNRTDQNNKIYDKITDLFFYEDIYIYSNKEFFIDITNYQELYQKSAYQLALELKNTLSKKFHIPIRIGMGTNLFLAKTACDIITKEKKIDIAYLDEKEYISLCSTHQPLKDFWQISNSMMLKLQKMNIYTMEDIRNYPYKELYKEFGYSAEYLINHSLGLEGATIQDLKKNKTPKTISSCMTLKPIKTRKESKKALKELVDFTILKLKENGLTAKTIHLYIKYANNIIPRSMISIKLNTSTNQYQTLMKEAIKAYENQANLFLPIEKLAVSFGEIKKNEDSIYPIPTKKKKVMQAFNNLLFKKRDLTFQSNEKMTILHT